MTDDQLAILRQKLADNFVPHLPPLLDRGKPGGQLEAKNVARAFAAFALQKILKLDAETASKAVVDDYLDNGLDAIHYHQPSKKLYLVQGKLKANEPFDQDEANAFTNGVRDFLNQRYDRFNQNLQNRQTELDAALDEATEILLVVAHTSDSISQHAQEALNHFLSEAEEVDERLYDTYVDFGPNKVVENLLAEHAVATVDDEIVMFGHHRIDAPRVTYYGQVSVASLATLYTKHGNALLDKNIRYFLGIDSSDVNKAIRGTLETAPDSFFYLSNGVTAIAHTIEPKGHKDGGRRFEVQGLSIINGAQTIASSQHFIQTHPQADVSAARVLFTLIQVDQADIFSVGVTRARNHQNPVSLAHFAALDDIQERLRRELYFDKIIYRYRPEAPTTMPGIDAIGIGEAAIALALIHPDPGFPVTIKREPAKLLDTHGSDYGRLFNSDLSGRRLANAVRFYNQALRILGANEVVAGGMEKLIYRHGRYATMWLTLRANIAWLNRSSVISAADAAALLSQPLDAWRERVRAEAVSDLAAVHKGPLAFFRSLTNTRPFIVRLRDAGL